MTPRYSTTLQMLALMAALGTTLAMAQDGPAEPLSMELLLELAANNAVDDVLNLPSAELGAILAGASDDQIAQLVGMLSPAQADSLVASVAQSGTEPANVAKIATAVISSDPESAERVANVVRDNTAPVDLPEVADAMVDQVERSLAEPRPDVTSALTSATISMDSGSARRLVEVADRQGDAGDTIIRDLATISESADPDVVEAIETAVQQSPRSSQVFAETRGEVPPASVEPDPIQAVDTPPAPVVPTAEIGGPGTTPGDTPANDAGTESEVATNSSSVGGGTPSIGGGGGGSTPPSDPDPVSPTD